MWATRPRLRALASGLRRTPPARAGTGLPRSVGQPSARQPPGRQPAGPQSAPAAEPPGSLVARLRDIEELADAALSRLDERALLDTLLARVKKVLRADTATVLLLDRSASQLAATAASGIVAAALDELLAGAADRGGRPVPLAEDACAAVMRALVGTAQARDDIALLALHRQLALAASAGGGG